MASGPFHYGEAERLQALANEQEWVAVGTDMAHEDYRWTPQARLAILADAQVHATLALAAATAQAAGKDADDPLVRAPVTESPIEPGYKGNDWGRALTREAS